MEGERTEHSQDELRRKVERAATRPEEEPRGDAEGEPQEDP